MSNSPHSKSPHLNSPHLKSPHLIHVYPEEHYKFNPNYDPLKNMFEYDKKRHNEIEKNYKLSDKQKKIAHEQYIEFRKSQRESLNEKFDTRGINSNIYKNKDWTNFLKQYNGTNKTNKSEGYINIVPYYEEPEVVKDLTNLLIHRQLSVEYKNRMLQHFKELENTNVFKPYLMDYKDALSDITKAPKVRGKSFIKDTEFRKQIAQYNPAYVDVIAHEIETQKNYLKGLDLAKQYLKKYEGATYDEKGKMVKPSSKIVMELVNKFRGTPTVSTV